MSAITQLAAKTRTKKAAPLVLPDVPVPQVNLLPPEVGAARKADTAKRWAVIAVVGALVLSAAAWGVLQIGYGDAKDKLREAQDQTSALRAEQARYAEVPQILAQQDQLRATRSSAFATDVDWKVYISGAVGVLPEGTALERIDGNVATLMSGEVNPVDGLSAPGIGQVKITARSNTVPDAGALVAAMNSIAGLSEARAESVTLVSDADSTFYRIVVTAQLNQGALRPSPFDNGED
ncbi:MAG: hypothetical protein FWF02_02050 [Micrococcales bacterium]|nr:hypothetical protein [Micrococcales bacterium]MCL2666473.1 hypothetical protein [Micrococcales bacterium]